MSTHPPNSRDSRPQTCWCRDVFTALGCLWGGTSVCWRPEATECPCWHCFGLSASQLLGLILGPLQEQRGLWWRVADLELSWPCGSSAHTCSGVLVATGDLCEKGEAPAFSGPRAFAGCRVITYKEAWDSGRSLLLEYFTFCIFSLISQRILTHAWSCLLIEPEAIQVH